MRIQAPLSRSLLLLLCSCVAVWGQLYTGSITGTVHDPSGAVVPNARVTITDAARGTSSTAVTDGSGLYTVRNLPPATYTVKVEATGFATYQRPNVVLEVNGNVEVGANLQVATAGQTVTVAEAPPLLQTEDATTGQTVNRLFINDLPLVNRNVFDLAFLAPGVSQPPGQTYGVGAAGGGNFATNFVSDGSRNAQADLLLDGVSIMNEENNTGITKAIYVPPVDAVEEFKVQQTNFSAEIGNSGGTVVNVVTRSGTNQFHGELFEFFRNNDLNANNFFANAAGIGQAHQERNDFGGTFGGPIIRNKTFFFFDYDQVKALSGASAEEGVPSAAEHAGNFGELCGDLRGSFNGAGICSNPGGQIYDPFTGTYNAAISGAVNRSPIPFDNLATYISPGNPLSPNGNLAHVAGNLIDPVAAKLMAGYPNPNLNVGTAAYNPLANWAGNATIPSTMQSFDIKVDHHITDNDTLSVRFSHEWFNGVSGANFYNDPYNTSTQGPLTDSAYLGVVNYTHTFNPTTIMTVSLGYGHDLSGTSGSASIIPGFNQVSTLGMPAYTNTSGYSAAPSVWIFGGQATGADFNGQIGSQGWSILKYASETAHLIGSIDKVVGNHELKFGAELRRHRINFLQPRYPAGIYAMDGNGTALNSNGGVGTGGNAFATFLTGYSDNAAFVGLGNYEIPPSVATQSFQSGGFIQDNWHASSRLTFNIGLRYDLEEPRTERFNRMNYFDPSAPNPIPGYTGALEFLGLDGNSRREFNTYYGEIGPRFGFAYRLGTNSTVRGGYGIYYDPSDMSASGTAGNGLQGYEGLTYAPENLPTDPAVPLMFLRNPFPLGISQPTGSSLGPATGIGDSVAAPIRTWNKVPQEQSWSFGLEHQLHWGLLVDAEYVGRKGTHLYFNGANSLDIVPESVANAYRAGQSATYNALVPNPFHGNPLVDPTSGLGSGATVPLYQLTLPYPQYSGVSGSFLPVANSIYNGVNLRLEKRFSGGVQFLVTYTFQKSMDDSSLGSNGYSFITSGGSVLGEVQDPYNLRLERSVSQFNIPQIFQFSWVYQIPYGRGQKYGSSLNRVADFFIGGWQANGIYRWDDGLPITLGYNEPGGNAIPTFGNQRPNLTAPLQVCGTGNLTQYFCNPQVVTVPLRFVDGTAPRTLPNARTPGTDNLTASLFKSFPLGFREGARVEFRLEAFNALNRVQFAGPNTTLQPTGALTGNFGQITSQANLPRQVQLGLKLYF